MLEHVEVSRGMLRCRACQRQELLAFPVAVSKLMSQLHAFIELHQSCKEVPRPPVEHRTDERMLLSLQWKIGAGEARLGGSWSGFCLVCNRMVDADSATPGREVVGTRGLLGVVCHEHAIALREVMP